MSGLRSRRRRARLRVAVPESLARLPGASGVGRWWVNTLAELDRIVRLEVIGAGAPAGRRRASPRVDAWLGESSHGPLSTDKPVVTLVHEAAWTDPTLRGFLEPAFLAVIEPATAASVKEATAVLAVSESTRRQVIETYGVAGESVHTVYPGVDHRVFHPGRGAGRALAQRHGLTTGTPYVLYAASLHPRKNLVALREAMIGLVDRGFPHRLVIVGAPAYDRPDSAALAEELLGPLPGVSDRVVSVPFPTTDEELAALMADADVFCLPSFMEGLGLPVLEAMACGTPAVVSDRGALPEVVADTGIVTMPTVAAVEGALAALLADDQHRAVLGRAAYERALAFTWSATADGWLQVLESAVSG